MVFFENVEFQFFSTDLFFLLMKKYFLCHIGFLHFPFSLLFLVPPHLPSLLDHFCFTLKNKLLVNSKNKLKHIKIKHDKNIRIRQNKQMERAQEKSQEIDINTVLLIYTCMDPIKTINCKQ